MWEEALNGTQADNGRANGHHEPPPEETPKPNQKLRYKDMAKLSAILWRDGKVNKSTGVYTYNAGKSDETTRDEAGTHIRLDLLASLRRQAYGPLESEMKGKPGRQRGITQLSIVMAKQKELEERIAFLEASLGVEHRP